MTVSLDFAFWALTISTIMSKFISMKSKLYSVETVSDVNKMSNASRDLFKTKNMFKR